MRLVEIHSLLKKIIPSLKFTSTPIDQNNIKLSDFREAICSIKRLNDSGLFRSQTQQILSIENLILATSEEIIINNNVLNNFANIFNSLKNKIYVLNETLRELLPEQNVDSISIRLPDDINLRTAGQYLIDIEKILSQSLINEYIKGEVKLLSFDRGSEWIDIFLGSGLATSFFFGIVRFYYECKEREIQLRAKEDLVTDLHLQVEYREAIRNAILKKIEEENEKDFLDLLKTGGIPESDHEQRKRIELSTSMLGKMLEAGLQVHPSLNAPNELTNILPDPAKVLDLIKQLPTNETNL